MNVVGTDPNKVALLDAAKDFTVLIKNQVIFLLALVHGMAYLRQFGHPSNRSTFILQYVSTKHIASPSSSCRFKIIYERLAKKYYIKGAV